MIDLKKQIKKYKSISEIAEALDMSQPNLSQQLSRRTISLDKLENIAKVCNCSLSELFATEEDNKAPQEISLSINGQSFNYIIKPTEDN